jgi:aspartate/methionine/tyrosine aminotransferase
VLVISDEIYGLVHHRREHISIAGVYPEGTIVTTGLSKHLSLGGFRVGIALVPQALNDIHAAMVRIASETWSTVAAPIQYAVLCAFENDPEIESYIQTCTKVHSLVCSYLRQVLLEIGIDYPPLDGGFYLYPDFEIFRKGLEARSVATNEELVRHLIDEIQLVTLPGVAFGDDARTLRIRFAPCDYEGLEALEYFRENPNCTAESLVANCCPNIRLAGQRLRKYFLEMRV